ncbi:MAG: VOC family protein [Bacillota bacterium]
MNDQTTDKKVPDLRRIDTIFLNVKDSKAASEWYASKLGLNASYAGNGLGRANPPSGIGITMLSDPGHNAGVLFNYFTPDIRRAYDTMKENGVEIVGEIKDFGDFAEFNFKDLEGNLMMVCSWPEKSPIDSQS